jgi:hypothetical protein
MTKRLFVKSKGYSKARTWLQDDFYLPTPTKAPRCLGSRRCERMM